MAEHFCSIFPRRDSFIWKTYDQERWQKAKGPLLDNQILGVVSDSGRGLYRGTYWSHKTRHAVFDIDAGSSYHQVAELQELQAKLAAVGLSAKPYQSSDSGGWHVYLPFDGWEDSSQVETLLKTWLKAEKYRIESGQLEVFPSGNALRLPLQKGFGWLDPEGNLIRRREEIREDEALASFLCDLENHKRNWSEAKNRIESRLRPAGSLAGAGVQAHREAIDTDGFDRLWNSGRIAERIEEARYYLDHGLTGDGQRHAAIFAIEHLLWFGDPLRGVPRLPGTHNDERRQRFLTEWLEKNHNGYCDHIKRGNWRELNEHIRRACEWRRQDHPKVVEFVPYMVTERATDAMIGLSRKTGHLFTPADLEKANIKRETKAREKIRLAAEGFSKQGRKLTIRGLARASGCDRHTIRRHSDIWLISPTVAPLSKGGGDLDPGGLGGLAALGCSASCPEKKEKEIFSSEIQGYPRRAVVDNPGTIVLAAVAEESFLSSALQEDSRQTSHCGCWQWDQTETQIDLAASQGSSEAPPSPPLAAAWSSLVADSALCLLSCADRQVATVRESDGMEAPESLASPSRTQPSTGSKHWLGGSLGTCGLNGFLPSSAEPPLGPLHLNPREIFYKGSGSVMLQDGGSSSGMYSAPVGEGNDRGVLVCYTNATESGINERAGAASVTGVLLSFGLKHKNKKTDPDVTNYKFLTTGSCGFSSGIPHEIPFLFRGRTEPVNEIKPASAPALSVWHGLFVISQTYRLRGKQTSVIDVRGNSCLGELSTASLHQSTASAPESTSTCLRCCVRLSWFYVVTHAPIMGACPSCRQLLDKHLQVSSDSRIRGPPKCKQRMNSQYR